LIEIKKLISFPSFERDRILNHYAVLAGRGMLPRPQSFHMLRSIGSP